MEYEIGDSVKLVLGSEDDLSNVFSWYKKVYKDNVTLTVLKIDGYMLTLSVPDDYKGIVYKDLEKETVNLNWSDIEFFNRTIAGGI